MKIHRKSIQRSWEKLESFFVPQLTRSPSIRPSPLKTKSFIAKSLSRSPSKVHTKSTSSFLIPGVSQGQIEELYYARCKDLQISAQRDHRNKFFLYCTLHFANKDIKLLEYGLGPKSAKVIGEILARNAFFAYVRLGKNYLGDNGVVDLMTGIMDNTTIVHLDLSNNNLSPEGCVFILKSLANHRTLYSLNLGSFEALHKNKLGKASKEEIKNFLSQNSVIGVLNLYGVGVSEVITEIAFGVTQSKSLVSLNLGGNALGPSEVNVIASPLRGSGVLVLDLSENCIGNEGASIVADAIASEYFLQQLHLRGNQIGFKGCKEIFSSLYSNVYLEKLDLSQNPMHFLPKEIANSLDNNTSLKDLNLSECLLKKEALLVLSKLFAKNKGIVTLNLSSNNIEDSSISKLSFSLSRNIILKYLNLSRNKISNQGAVKIAAMLKVNQSLIEVNLQENMIKDLGAEELEEATRVNNTILRLNLELNSFASKHAEMITKHLKNNSETRLKLIPTQVRQQIARMDFNKNSLEDVHKKFIKSVKEKEELIGRVAKQNEKFDEAKKMENEKMEKLKTELLELKEKHCEVDLELESIQKEIRVGRI